MSFSGRLFAPYLQADPSVSEEQNGEGEAVLKDEEDVGVLGLLDPILPHLLADVALPFLVPGVVRQDELRDEESGQSRQGRHDPHKSDDPLVRNRRSLVGSRMI